MVFYTFAKRSAKKGWNSHTGTASCLTIPPLTAHYLQLIFYLDHQAFFRASGLTFPVLLRLPGILADFVVLLVLLEIPKKHAEIRIPTWALALFALSPVSPWSLVFTATPIR